jgi:N-acyl-D-amino-acid deacylase
VIELCRIAAKRGGLYATHMRSESDHIIEALDEAITIAREAGIALQISHLKVSGRDNWHKLDRVLGMIDDARDEGLDVQADRYPYTAACTDLDILFPSWVHDGGRAPALARLADSSTRQRIHDELLDSRAPDYWGGVTVGSTQHADTRRFQGVPLPAVATALEMDPAAAILWLTEHDQLGTTAFFESMAVENTRRILQRPYVMIGCDASIRSPGGLLGSDYPHPRTYGTFPRFLRMAADEGLMSLAEAIRRCTSLPAERFGLTRRGVVAAGHAADLAIFDLATLRDRSTFADPHQLATGMRHVIVNGTLALEDARLTGHHAGQVL